MFLEYAKNQGGQYVHTSETEKRNPYFCPFCKNRVYAKKGAINVHHFAHKKNESCKEWGLLASLDYSMYKPLTGTQADLVKELIAADGKTSIIVRLNRWGTRIIKDGHSEDGAGSSYYLKYTAKSYQSIERKGFISYCTNERVFFWRGGRKNQYLNNDTGNQLLISPLCNIYNLTATFKEAFTFFNGQFESEVNKAVFGVFSHLKTSVLYFISIDADKERFYKIGVTSDFNRRKKEIEYFLKGHFNSVKIKPLKVCNLAILEHYFKRVYSANRYPLKDSKATEYFTFDSGEVKDIMSGLSNAQLHTDTHRSKIMKGLANRSPNVRGKEAVSDFLEKPKIKQVIAFLVAGDSLRVTAKAANCSINTVRKVKALM